MLKATIKKSLHGSAGTMQLDVSLQINEGDFIALAGSSGSGKTTLLRILAGLEKSDASIEFNDALWQDAHCFIAPQKRHIGFMFQEYALFENMSVLKNLLYVSPDETLANELMRMTNITALQHRKPSQLSGGQKQRVALCRAFMVRPKLLLMDEPLSALDPAMRQQLQHDILKLHQRFETTTIMVSHDPSEIFRLCSRVLLLQHGSIVRDGTPSEIFLHTQGSQKFSFEGEILQLREADVIFIAIIAIGQQIVEVVIDEDDFKRYSVGQRIRVSTKAFTPVIST